MKFFKRPLLAAPIVGLMAMSMAWGTQTSFAQWAPPNTVPTALAVYGAWSSTDITSAAASALGITAAELRKDIVAGQSLQAIAQSKNIDLQIVMTAIQTASKADIDQAVKDGILTQDEATALESGNQGGPQGNRAGGQPNGQSPQGGQAPQPGQPGGQPPQGGQAPQGGQPNDQQGARLNQLPDISNLRFLLQTGTSSGTSATPDASAPRQQGNGRRGFGRGFGGAKLNLVKPYVVAAQAPNMKCSDLVQTLVTTSRKTIASVPTYQKR